MTIYIYTYIRVCSMATVYSVVIQPSNSIIVLINMVQITVTKDISIQIYSVDTRDER